jgi:biopolymer transport protein ExbB
MSTLYKFFQDGGPLMYPLAGLSIATLACGMERGLFWSRLLLAESKVAHDVLAASKYSLTDAKMIAKKTADLPIGRFLLAPLQLNRPTPETFRLALETTAEEEFAKMRKGDSILESTIGIAPLLGLLGTVTGLIATFMNLNIGGGGSAGGGDLGKAAAGIGEALATTAGGMFVAIIALTFLRIFVTLQAQQMDYFTKIGGELELIYRQCWYEPAMEEAARAAAAGGETLVPESPSAADYERSAARQEASYYPTGRSSALPST